MFGITLLVLLVTLLLASSRRKIEVPPTQIVVYDGSAIFRGVFASLLTVFFIGLITNPEITLEFLKRLLELFLASS
jgi:hypothetical protein